MKPRVLGLLAGLASIGFGWWLLAQPHTSRELMLSMVAWVLGFWVATGIRGDARRDTDLDFDDDEIEEDDE